MVYCGKPSKGAAKNYLSVRIVRKRAKHAPAIKAKAKEKARNARSASDSKSLAPAAAKPRKLTSRALSSVCSATRRSQSLSTSPPAIDYPGHGEFEYQGSPGAALALASTDRGTTYFINNFVAEESGPSHGHFNYLKEMCRKGGMNETLSAGLSAVGLAALSNKIRSPQLLGEARHHYTITLRRVNAALRSSTEAVKDSTLLSIMVLTVYETVTCTNQLSLKAWTEHINGASTLIKLRGPSQFRTRIGIGMFMQITSHLLISAVQREIPMPPEIVALRAQVQKRLDPTDPAFRLLAIIDKFAKFRADLRTQVFGDSASIIQHALALDQEVVEAFYNVPPGWEYETVEIDKNIAPHIVYDGKYDIYYDYWVAQLWNSSRNCRLLLNEVIRQHILEGFKSVPPLFTDSLYTAQYQLSTDTLVELRNEILRSIPQSLGYVTRKPSSWKRSPSSSSRTPSPPSFSDPFADLYPDLDPSLHPATYTAPSLSSTPNPSHPAIGAYFLVWPLYIAGVTRVTSSSERIFITENLRRLHTDYGIAQGAALAHFIETSPIVANRKQYEQNGVTVGLGRSILEMNRMQTELKGMEGPLPCYEPS
ncbi:hypothetical protein CJF30_00007731 [Rutstroemia sp. NJR-2017a BBW]|nr:hypothetical protein CJF30_00007731 [Rutstroemia sp. NJR-2017a BBW]